jgi:hypothetical protein
MTKPTAALRAQPPHTPYSSLSLTREAISGIRRLAALLGGKAERKVSMSEAILTVISVVDFNEAAAKIKAAKR